ncbi:MAG: hypothetical protein IPN55_13155 [Saprospiraceae bacterium]|nr:hypothetical protein [Candidatus Brachybacter algidus]
MAIFCAISILFLFCIRSFTLLWNTPHACIGCSMWLFSTKVHPSICNHVLFQKWRPPMGIAMNIVSFLVIISMLFHFMSGNIFEWIAWDRVAFLYTVLILCILATDSVYAWMFYKIVGLRTMGENGIWFASDDDPAFRKINWITSRLNIFFFIFFGLILYLIFTNYGSYVY